MEAKNMSESGSPMFPLNFDCLHEIFQRLGVDECMNLAEAYDGLQCVADWIFKTKLNKITIDFEKRMNIDRILYHIGPFVQSLKLMLFDKFWYTEEDLLKIQQACKELKSLELMGLDRRDVKEIPFYGASDKLEVLTLFHCSLAEDEDFFNGFTNLKSLNIVGCTGISNSALKVCFQNNKGITSFVCDNHNLNYSQLLQLLPDLEQLGLHYDSRRMDLSVLSLLKCPLRSLTLHCRNGNVNVNVLARELATKNQTLEELELTNVFVDGNTFEIIKSFQKLQRLAITTRNCKFTSPNELPHKLRTLKLGGFHISQRQIVSLIEQRKHLENIHIADCSMKTKRGFNFNSICHLDKNRKVNLILTTSGSKSSKVNITVICYTIAFYSVNIFFRQKTVTKGCISLSNHLPKSNKFKIVFPGMDNQ